MSIIFLFCQNLSHFISCISVPSVGPRVARLRRASLPALRVRLEKRGPRHRLGLYKLLQAACLQGGRNSCCELFSQIAPSCNIKTKLAYYRAKLSSSPGVMSSNGSVTKKACRLLSNIKSLQRTPAGLRFLRHT
jgi:hypothetical protein